MFPRIIIDHSKLSFISLDHKTCQFAPKWGDPDGDKAVSEVVPTSGELEILRVLWRLGEATVRDVYEAIRERRSVAQNTIQAFLRTMERKGLVSHRVDGRSFVYRSVIPREATSQRLLDGVLHKVFDGALDQLVESALTLRDPTPEELARLRALLDSKKERDR